MKKILFALGLFITSFFSYAQTSSGKQKININGVNYPCTKEWNFEDKIHVQVSLHTQGSGYLILTACLQDDVYQLAGDAYITLSNGDVVKCSYAGISEVVDDCSNRVYNISAADIKKMRTVDGLIKSIKYSISIMDTSVDKKSYTIKNSVPWDEIGTTWGPAFTYQEINNIFHLEEMRKEIEKKKSGK